MSHHDITTETISFRGAHGDAVAGYLAQPRGRGPFSGVVFLHHMPGWDEWTREVTRKFADHGYATLTPHLFHRDGPQEDPVALAARVREAGGVPDNQVLGDITGAMAVLRGLPNASGKIAVAGVCSGGRQAYLAAALVPGLDAAVDCWGGRVVPQQPDDITEKRHLVGIDLTDRIACPLLGLFGNEDSNPSPAAVDRIEAELKRHGKPYEFHRYDGAGHAFFASDRPNYRWQQANDGWRKVFDFLARHLNG
ncbi:MAG TPA: dienelactone hydrolase family protein [Xanthobacteraceae bacterium]|nr:dienelactone hydrolase family protein [Xanthobacteraceae bacterium]